MSSKYLRRQGGLNFLGHMRIESSAEKKFLESRKNDPIITSGKLDQIDSKALDSVYARTGGNPELMRLLVDITDIEGVDVENTVSVFRCGYRGISKAKCLTEREETSEKGGFENTVYVDKVKLPFWMWGVSIGMIVLGLAVSLVVLIFGKTRWKYITAIFWGFWLILGVIIVVSFITGTTWKLTTLVLQTPIPYLQVSQEDTEFYYNKAQQATNEFFKTGQLPFDDASGLSYVDSKTGVLVKGALIEAQGTAKIIYMIVLPIMILILNIWLFKKSFGLSRKRK